MNQEKINQFLLEALEHEKGGVKVYETALRCALNEDLKEEWTEYLEQTENHVAIATRLLEELGFDPKAQTPGQKIIRHLGESLVKAMEMALKEGDPETAEVVAAECIVLAEKKDHHNWELIGELAKASKGAEKKAFDKAHSQVEDEEDEHLYHTMGWARELHLQGLGLPAVLPPPEEEKEVTTAIGAARAKSGRTKMLKGSAKKK